MSNRISLFGVNAIIYPCFNTDVGLANDSFIVEPWTPINFRFVIFQIRCDKRLSVF